jgi:hypothetical protein
MQDTPLHPSHLHTHAYRFSLVEYSTAPRSHGGYNHDNVSTIPLQVTRHTVPGMIEYTEAKRRAAENATLLFCLNEQPNAPHETTYAPSISSSELSIRREMQLAEDFAYISSMKDDPNGVTAVCMEADYNTGGIAFRVATNTGCPSHIVQQLQMVADIMVRASKRGMLLKFRSKLLSMQLADASINQTEIPLDLADRLLFEQITQMCYARILSRLRSKHAAKTQKTRGKPKMPELLLQTMSECKREISICRQSNATKVARMQEQCKTFGEVFEGLEESDDKQTSLQHLDKLMSLAHRFEVHTLATVLDQSSAMDPTLKEYLPRAIEKLGRYRSIATGLANASRTKKHSLFRSITVRPIELPDLKLDNRSLTSSLQDFENVWSRNAGDVSHSLLRQLREETKVKYHTRIHTCGTKWKVHAEVQILMFYEQRPCQALPRVICSSKSACYLCSLFLETHGRFIVPRTHGRIYDRWTLPSEAAFDSKTMESLLPVLHRFNQAVEVTIRKALKGELVKLAPPNESVIALYEPWSSHSTVVPRGPVVALDSHTQGEKSAPVDRNTKPGDSRRNANVCGSGRASKSSSAVSVIVRSDTRTRSWYLEQGEHISKELVPGETILIQTSAIHLQFSCTGEQLMGDADTPTGLYRLHVEHLNRGSGMASGAQVVDVDKLQCDREETICLDRLSGISRIVCRSGEHRVCLLIDKTPRKAVP